MTENITDDRTVNPRPGLIGSAVALLVSAGVSIWGWIQIPDDALLPVHWGPSGEADRFAGKIEALGLLPLIMLGLCVMFVVLPRLLPRRRHMASSAHTYTAAWIGSLALLTGIHTVSIVNATGGELPVVRFVIAGVGALFLVLGNYLPKTRSNWAVGVRTPWTMQSERSWRLTHRLAGRLFAGLGVVLLVIAFLLPLPALFPVVLVGAAVASLVPLTYSWWVWRAEQGGSADTGR
ncbi:SdpI family protein [Streptosporangium amethystogenes subsp. fukuiense]|uniref:SdpI family protein n=1 Tax=Streptosporangium amethystogenes subsp. fukuiense TaxID=698418 RepID=A0ABW2SZT2_9ACTN